jgi:hypothetical protein
MAGRAGNRYPQSTLQLGNRGAAHNLTTWCDWPGKLLKWDILLEGLLLFLAKCFDSRLCHHLRVMVLVRLCSFLAREARCSVDGNSSRLIV